MLLLLRRTQNNLVRNASNFPLEVLRHLRELSASLNSPIIGDIPLYAFINVKAMRLFSSVGVLISLRGLSDE